MESRASISNHAQILKLIHFGHGSTDTYDPVVIDVHLSQFTQLLYLFRNAVDLVMIEFQNP